MWAWEIKPRSELHIGVAQCAYYCYAFNCVVRGFPNMASISLAQGGTFPGLAEDVGGLTGPHVILLAEEAETAKLVPSRPLTASQFALVFQLDLLRGILGYQVYQLDVKKLASKLRSLADQVKKAWQELFDRFNPPMAPATPVPIGQPHPEEERPGLDPGFVLAIIIGIIVGVLGGVGLRPASPGGLSPGPGGSTFSPARVPSPLFDPGGVSGNRNLQTRLLLPGLDATTVAVTPGTFAMIDGALDAAIAGVFSAISSTNALGVA